MFLAEFFGELARPGLKRLRLEFVSFSHQLLENALRLPNQRSASTQLAETRTRQMEFVVPEQFLEHSKQPTRAGPFGRCCLCQKTQGFVLEADFDSVCAKCALIL